MRVRKKTPVQVQSRGLLEMDAKVTLMKNGGARLILFTSTHNYYLFVQVAPALPPLAPSLTSRLKSAVCAVSARSSVHSQGVLRCRFFSEDPFNGLA